MGGKKENILQFLFSWNSYQKLAFMSYDMPKKRVNPWSNNNLSVDYLPIPGGSLSNWTIHLWLTTVFWRVLNTGLTEWGYYFDIQIWRVLTAMSKANYLVLHFVWTEKKGEYEFSNFSPIPIGAQYFKLCVLSWKPIPLLWLKRNGSQFENRKTFI